MPGVSHLAPCPRWQHGNRLNSGELRRSRVGSPACTLRGTGHRLELAALWHLLHTTELLLCVCHMQSLQEAPVFRPGRKAAEALQLLHPSTPFSHGTAIPSSVRGKRTGAHGTKEHSDDGGGRKGAARKPEPNLIHLSLNLDVPVAVSFWW